MRIGFISALALAGSLFGASTLAQDTPAEPPGYIYVTGWYKDAGVFREYGRAVGPLLRDYEFEGSILGLEGQNLRVLEGDWIPGRIMLIKFPTEDHVKRFWWSDAYQEVKKIRDPISAVDIAQVDGVEGVTPRMDGKAAYLVFLAEIKDRDLLVKDYAPYAPQVVAKHGGQFIVRSSRAAMELLEGDIPNASVVVVEFPDVDSMTAFWNDPEYQRLSEIRKQTGKWSVAEVTPSEGQ